MKLRLKLEDLAIPVPDATIKSEPRTVVWRQELPDGDRVVVKLYRRRSRFAGWRGRIARFRTEREFLALDHLGRHDVPCVEPLLWTHGRSAEHGRYEFLVTREIPEAVCMRELVGRDRGAARRVDLGAIFREVGRLHHSGLFHGTLWASNILIAPDDGPEFRFYFIDPPRSVLFPHDIFGTRMSRGDLLDLSYSVGRLLRIPDAELPLDDYGLGQLARERFLRDLSGYRPGKLRRGLVRGQALARRLSRPPGPDPRELGMSESSRSDVSIVVPTFNRASVVGKAVDSALGQNPSPREVLVVDDGSTDETPNVLATFLDRVRVHRQANAGVSAARNAGIERSRGGIVGFLDSDDVLLPDALGRGLAVLGEGADAALFSARQELPGPGPGGPWTKPLPGIEYRLAGLLGPDEAWALPCGLFRRGLLTALGGFDEEMRCGEDYLLLLRAVAEGYSVRIVRDPGFLKDRSETRSRLSDSTAGNMRGKLDALDRFERAHPAAAGGHRRAIATLRSRYRFRLGRCLAAADDEGSHGREAAACLLAAYRGRPARLDYLLEAAFCLAAPRAYRRHRKKRLAAR